MSNERQDPIVTEEAVAPEQYWHVPRLLAAWLLTALAALIVCVTTSWEVNRIEWLTVVLAGGTLATFGLQLGTAQRQGFIARTALSVGGVVLVVAIVAGLSFLSQL